VLKSYSLKHESGEELEPLLHAHRDVVNRVLEELWAPWNGRRGSYPERSSGGSYPSTPRMFTTRSIRRSSGTGSSKSGLSRRTGLTQPSKQLTSSLSLGGKTMLRATERRGGLLRGDSSPERSRHSSSLRTKAEINH